MQPWWIDFLLFIPELVDSALEIAQLIFFLLGIRLMLAALPLVEKLKNAPNDPPKR